MADCRDAETQPRKRILCVDDDPNILRALRVVLGSQRYEVITAENGETALELLAQQKPDLLILDIMMDDISGYEVMRRLPEIGADDVPVVLLTAKGEVDDILTGYEKGATYYIPKPFKNDYVVNIVEYLIGNLSEEQREEMALRL